MKKVTLVSAATVAASIDAFSFPLIASATVNVGGSGTLVTPGTAGLSTTDTATGNTATPVNAILDTGTLSITTAAKTAGITTNGVTADANTYGINFNTSTGDNSTTGTATTPANLGKGVAGLDKLVVGISGPQSASSLNTSNDQFLVQDGRGTFVGWNVTASLSALTTTQTETNVATPTAANQTLVGATLTFSAPTISGDSTTGVTGTAAVLTAGSATPSSITTAAAGDGEGQTVTTLGASTLAVPSTAVNFPGLYSGKILYTLNDSPTGVN